MIKFFFCYTCLCLSVQENFLKIGWLSILIAIISNRCLRLVDRVDLYIAKVSAKIPKECQS